MGKVIERARNFLKNFLESDINDQTFDELAKEQINPLNLQELCYAMQSTQKNEPNAARIAKEDKRKKEIAPYENEKRTEALEEKQRNKSIQQIEKNDRSKER